MVTAKPSRSSDLSTAPTGASDKLLLAACRVGHVLTIGAILLLVASCEEEPEVIEEIRSIKSFTVGEMATGQILKFPGIVRAVAYGSHERRARNRQTNLVALQPRSAVA